MLEQKYNKPKLDYYVSVIWRKLSTSILAYPEFIFLGKILMGFIGVGILFYLFKQNFGF